jgi:hypothetical protein
MVPDTLRSVSFIEKDTNRFPDTSGWPYAQFLYDTASARLRLMGSTPSAGTRVMPRWRQKITFSRRIRRAEGGHYGGLLVVSDHRIDTGSESFHGKGLDHYLHAEFDLDTPERGVLGVAGNKQHFQPG